jgi:hypothetical protein
MSRRIQMNRKIRSFACLAVLSLFLMSSCASTKLAAVWKDESYTEKVNNVLVIGISKKTTVKRFFEDEFVKRFKARGINAVPSYSVFPEEGKMGKGEIEAKARELGLDAVLLTRMIDKKTLETYIPGQVYVAPGRSYDRYYDHYRRGGYYGYYGRGYDYIYTPGYTIEEKVVYMETNIYLTEGDKLIWSALSETFIEGAPYDLIKSFIDLLMKDLSKKGLV